MSRVFTAPLDAISVTNDSGPMHLSAALDRPVVAIFGPTDPVWIGPYGHPDNALRAGVPCSPCLLRQLSRCHYGHVCMEQVSARAVIARIDHVLGASDAAALSATQNFTNA